MAVFTACSAHANVKTVYAKRNHTKILSAPSGVSTVLTRVRAGEPLRVIGKKGNYYRVKTGKGITGYVFRLRVTDIRPLKALSTGDEDDLGLGEVSSGGNRVVKLEESEASHSIRGLRKRNPNAGAGTTNLEAKESVRKMERFKVNRSELKNFQREGKVGGYAR